MYSGLLDFAEETEQDSMPEIEVKTGDAERRNPGSGLRILAAAECRSRTGGWSSSSTIGIGIHPKALLEFAQLDEPLRSQIGDTTAAYETPRDFFVRRVAEGEVPSRLRLRRIR